MSAPLLDSDRCQVHVLPGEPRLSGQAMAVARGALPQTANAAGQAALLTVGAPDGPVQSAVRLVPLTEVPDGAVVVSDELAAGAGLADLPHDAKWRVDTVPLVALRRLRLEIPVEEQLDKAIRRLSDAGLTGRLLWIPPGGADDLWLDVDGLPYRIHLADTAGEHGVLAEITQATEVELFAAGARAGVDIVILADCSGSMSVADIPQMDEQPASRWRRGTPARQTRDEALKAALQYLLSVRLQISGRISRLALVKFTRETQQIFPRAGGMAELDASTAEAAQEFRAAVALLRPERAGTDIGNALHEAANLLYRHGKPGNEKLIVLVSDGAHWTPKGDQGVGEVVYAIKEPVSLMEHLHRDMTVRLHALGISTLDLYRQWLREGYQHDVSLEPNHTLLEQLVEVGGGDRAAIGGFDVLADYFSGLGSGVSRKVQLSAKQSTAPLSQEFRAAMDRIGRQRPQPRTAVNFGELADQLSEAAGAATREASRLFGSPLFKDVNNVQLVVARCVRGSQEQAEAYFARDVPSAFAPRRFPAEPDSVKASLDRLEEALAELRTPGALITDPLQRGRWLHRFVDLLSAAKERMELVPYVSPPTPAPGGSAKSYPGGPAATDVEPASTTPSFRYRGE